MNKALFISVCIFLYVQTVNGQSWISSNKISSTGTFITIASRITTDGEIVTYGYYDATLSSAGGQSITSLGGRDYYLIKFKQNGEVDWMNSFGSTMSDFVSGGMTIDTNKNIYITGAFMGNFKYSDTDSLISTGAFDMFLVKLDSLGTPIWARQAGIGERLQSSTALDIDNNGDLILSGIFLDSIKVYDDFTLYSINASVDYFYAKFETNNGDVQWIKHANTFSDLGGRLDYIFSGQNYYLLTGTFYDSVGFETDTIIPHSSDPDVQLLHTDLDGNLNWIRTIGGVDSEFSYTVLEDDEGYVYLAGYYNSDTMTIQSSEVDSVVHIGNNGGFDIFLLKYSPTGDLVWYRTAGGKYEEKTFNMEFFDERVWISGYFSDTLKWGGISLTSSGPGDVDMFTGAFDRDGNFREANRYKGRSNSNDQGRGIFKRGDELFTLMRTNSDLISLGDSIYTSDGISFYMILGVIGCLPISVDNVFTNDIETCYGDSTGNIQIVASGGFGSPYEYSIDNGETYQDNQPFFADLPAGDYQIVVIDQENCAQEGPLVTLTQPDSLYMNVVSTANITNEADGHIEVEVFGGTPPYTYTLMPDSIVQGLGIFTFSQGDSGRYVVRVNDAQDCGPIATDTIEIKDVSDVTCLPISIDNVTITDVEGCNGDTTGVIEITASGGYGAPWQYSIDNGVTYQVDDPVFDNLPAGEYTILVSDAEDCQEQGSPVTISEPDPLAIESVTTTDITAEQDGSIEVIPSGGTPPYTYTLRPMDIEQDSGVFTFGPTGAGKYVVEVNDANLCGPVTTDSVEVINTVGIDRMFATDAKIYPNPTDGTFTVELPWSEQECNMEILSLTGQLILNRKVYPTAGLIREVIDMSGVPKGMYMMRMNGMTIRTAIVVN